MLRECLHGCTIEFQRIGPLALPRLDLGSEVFDPWVERVGAASNAVEFLFRIGKIAGARERQRKPINIGTVTQNGAL